MGVLVGGLVGGLVGEGFVGVFMGAMWIVFSGFTLRMGREWGMLVGDGL